MYERVKTRLFRYTMEESIHYLIEIGSNDIYADVVRYNPTLAVKFIDEAKISWDDFRKVDEELSRAQAAKYDPLIQAYYDRLGPISLMGRDDFEPDRIYKSLSRVYPNLSPKLERSLLPYTDAIIEYVNPRNRLMFQRRLEAEFDAASGSKKKAIYRTILQEFPVLAMQLIDTVPIEWPDFAQFGYNRRLTGVADLPAYEQLAQMYYDRLGPIKRSMKPYDDYSIFPGMPRGLQSILRRLRR